MDGLPLILTLIAVLAAIAIPFFLRRVTVFEYERGVKYRRGRFDRVLGPGQYWHVPLLTRIRKLDVRPRFLPIPGQEVLTSDGVSLKVSLAARYEIAEPEIAMNRVQDYQAGLYLELQMALREIIGTVPVDDVLEGRNGFSARLQEMTANKAEELGLKLHSVNVKDIMFPGALKQTFAQVVQARKEGQAALERARGETASLRNLANAAKLLEKNPTLMQLRMVHSLTGSSGNTLVLGLPAGAFPVGSNGQEKAPREGEG